MLIRYKRLSFPEGVEERIERWARGLCAVWWFVWEKKVTREGKKKRNPLTMDP